MNTGVALARLRSRRRLAIACVVLTLLAGPPALAGDCTINVSPIAFGDYDPVAQTAPLDVAGGVSVGCKRTERREQAFGVFVSITADTGSSGTYAARTLRAGGSSLQYNLFTDAARTTVWGDGSSGTAVVGGTVGGANTGQLNPRTFPVFGRIPGGQDPAPGAYADTVLITVTF